MANNNKGRPSGGLQGQFSGEIPKGFLGQLERKAHSLSEIFCFRKKERSL